jgi:hypothetical protein
MTGGGLTMRGVESGEDGGPFVAPRKRIEAWRASKRRKGERMPEELWAMAVELGRRHGVSRTSRQLGVDYSRLKRLVESETSVVSAQEGARFVELAVGELAAGCRGVAPECVVWYEDERVRLRFELRGPATSELVSLARALRSEGR